ncbi:hypothetical protein TTHERM_000939009 (macronuclear) [Tetrahymena thermophila SB210]|uniref:Uncharacterized protein n=1 Tax=Tetrahymena thermophila (strain SB210) TaxID=312017 RepID=W7X7G9_TETTS|nr:hypothetical protein TTHERM_000939009 [Tetrahymena thermophila SB210]EWS72328.1 hypothetical protein TTHERM_000939009 [Tetrahymena thermophila SB210]|eukprot:XP_012655136.1 hypothetical protein TTHERM_000939009 [Tetrahymena thermophila SB210]
MQDNQLMDGRFKKKERFLLTLLSSIINLNYLQIKLKVFYLQITIRLLIISKIAIKTKKEMKCVVRLNQHNKQMKILLLDIYQIRENLYLVQENQLQFKIDIIFQRVKPQLQEQAQKVMRTQSQTLMLLELKLKFMEFSQKSLMNIKHSLKLISLQIQKEIYQTLATI